METHPAPQVAASARSPVTTATNAPRIREAKSGANALPFGRPLDYPERVPDAALNAAAADLWVPAAVGAIVLLVGGLAFLVLA